MLYQEALTIMESLRSQALRCEVSTDQALGRILAEDLFVPSLNSQPSITREWEHGLQEGGLLLKAESQLNPERLMLLAGLGIHTVPVRAHPNILVYAVGDSSSSYHTNSTRGGSFNLLTSGSLYFQAALQSLGLPVSESMQFARKSSAILHRIQEWALHDHPTLIITTGSLTKETSDHNHADKEGTDQSLLAGALELGFVPVFRDLAIRPGKSIFLARRGPHLWLGMSHHPVTAGIAWNFFIRRLLASWALLPEPKTLTFKLKNQVSKPEHLRCFYRAEVVGQNVWINQRQGSTQLAATTNMHAYIELPEGQSRFTSETKVNGLLI